MKSKKPLAIFSHDADRPSAYHAYRIGWTHGAQGSAKSPTFAVPANAIISVWYLDGYEDGKAARTEMNHNICDRVGYLPNPLRERVQESVETNQLKKIRAEHDCGCEVCATTALPCTSTKSTYAEEILRLRLSLEQIKLLTLTGTDGPTQLARILRLCINAGITEKLDELQAKYEIKNKPLAWSKE